MSGRRHGGLLLQQLSVAIEDDDAEGEPARSCSSTGKLESLEEPRGRGRLGRAAADEVAERGGARASMREGGSRPLACSATASIAPHGQPAGLPRQSVLLPILIDAHHDGSDRICQGIQSRIRAGTNRRRTSSRILYCAHDSASPPQNQPSRPSSARGGIVT